MCITCAQSLVYADQLQGLGKSGVKDVHLHTRSGAYPRPASVHTSSPAGIAVAVAVCMRMAYVTSHIRLPFPERSGAESI